MFKITSKADFIEKLSFHLSFYFNDAECSNLISDYEEWFENETLEGKSEAEICAALDAPKKIVKKLLSESNTKPYQTFFHNSMLKVLLLMIMHLIAGLYFLKICNTNPIKFFPFIICINFIYFFIGTLLIKNCRPESFHSQEYFKSNLVIFGLFLLMILSEAYILPKMTSPNSGMICANVISIISLTLFFLNIYITVKKFAKDKLYGFLTIFHISGITTVLFYLMNQLHMLYDNQSFFKHLVLGSACIYAEIIILCAILYSWATIKTKLQKDNLWIHN